MSLCLSPIRQDLPAVYIMILIDVKGQVFIDPIRKCLKMCVSTLLHLHTFKFTYTN